MRRLTLLLLASCLLCTTGVAQDLTGTLKHIADSGEFTIGFVPDAPPLSFVNAEGIPAGYTIALCKTVAAAVKKATGLEDMKINYVPAAQYTYRILAFGEIDREKTLSE